MKETSVQYNGVQVSEKLWRKFFKPSLKNTSSITKSEKYFLGSWL